ncbi:hypothetical protein S7711_07148 [Stachybotrys chartarum IBT 7711]|uniref:Heterokaryon incompatibility domain-containing protein n=1 Tax=Stachybotrys chartarum (strain CBS 109288 / IBT 7711) TaxID=1280523 RepID=A0A084BAG3_STACB|nr:hypothetical protein S7711_07148 [Stachybotrys chartarum IBT 7711]
MMDLVFLLPWILGFSLLLRFLFNRYVKRKSVEAYHAIYSALPLRHHLRETRIVRLQPGKWIEAIRCHLDVVSLDSKPEFEALSYTWSENKDGARKDAKSRMILNGHNFLVSSNLKLALRQLRSETEARVLWVDAICINQSDIEERNEQVSMMRNIYSSCNHVIIWLGTVEEPRRSRQEPKLEPKEVCQWRTDFKTWSDSSVPHPSDLEIITDFQSRIEHYYTLPLSLRHSLNIDHVKGAFCFASLLAQNKHINGDEIPLLTSHDAFHRTVIALYGIMKRPWWVRQWVIQEVVLAPRATLHYGHFIAPWELFSHAARNYEHHRKDCCQDHYRTIVELDDLRHKWQNILENQAPFRINLRELLWQFRSRDTTDPKDKVYALFPLVNDWGDEAPMETNYKVEVQQLYRAVVEKVLATDKSLLILMGSTEKNTALRHLPSWIPDWTAKTSQFESERLERAILFNASRGTKANAQLIAPSTLKVEGVLFDVITTTSEMMVYGDDDETLDVFRSWYNLLCDQRPVTSTYATKESPMTAYWRTLCMDTVRSLGFKGDSFKKDVRYRRCSKTYVREGTRQWMNSTGLPYNKADSILQIPADTKHGLRAPSPHTLPVHEIGPRGEEKLTYVAVDFAVTSATMNRKLFFTKNGYMGLGPATMMVGDSALLES